MKKIFCMMAILVLGLFVLSGCGQQTQTPTGNVVKVTDDSKFIAKLSDVPSGSLKEFTYNGESAILVNFDGDLKAYVNECPHKDLPFNESSIVGDKIQCPWHGATFKPDTGEYDGHANGENYGTAGLAMINLNVENGNIYAE